MGYNHLSQQHINSLFPPSSIFLLKTGLDSLYLIIQYYQQKNQKHVNTFAAKHEVHEMNKQVSSAKHEFLEL